MEDLISVVVPIYNVEKYLKTCIDSILCQSYKKLEIILCNDGSTDSCPQICDEYAKIDSRIKVIHKKNGGLSDARNAGIEVAKGKYIIFIDSDDFINRDMIFYLYSSLIENRADMACCQRQEVDEMGHALQNNHIYKSFIIDDNRKCMKEFLKNPQMDTVAWGKIYRTSMFKDVRYPVGKYHEDVFTTYKIVAQCERIFVGEKKYYCYRIRTASIMTSSFSKKHMDSIKGNEERAIFIKQRYPELQKLANAGIIYAVNHCVLRLAQCENVDDESMETDKIVKKFQEYYKKYEFDYLQGASGIKAKIFSIIATINLPVLMYIVKKYYCGKKRGDEV